jgi:hypothetical protein
VKILVACEFSGIVRNAFARLGHDAWSCDLLPSEIPGQHILGDVRTILDHDWDLMVAHPPCTYLSRAGARWASPERDVHAAAATAFVLALWTAPIPRVAIENPIGQLNRRWRYPDQTVEPWYFGDPYTKRTCLWMRGLPPLLATVITTDTTPWLPSNSSGFRRGQRSRRGVVHGGKAASRTFPGFAQAMANQWG